MQAKGVAEFQTLLRELLTAGLPKSAAEFPGVVIELSLFHAHELDLTTSNYFVKIKIDISCSI